MVALAWSASLARDAATLVVLVTDQVDLAVRAGTCATPDACGLVIVDDDVACGAGRSLRSRRTDHLAERTLGLTTGT